MTCHSDPSSLSFLPSPSFLPFPSLLSFPFVTSVPPVTFVPLVLPVPLPSSRSSPFLSLPLPSSPSSSLPPMIKKFPYHNNIPLDDRPSYLAALSLAESAVSSSFLDQESLDTTLSALSALRGAESLMRLRVPLASSSMVSLCQALSRCRSYVTSFWADPLPPQKTTPQSTSSPQINTPSSPSSSPLSHPLSSSQILSPPLKSSPAPSSPSPTFHLDSVLPSLSPRLQKESSSLPNLFATLNNAHESLDRLVRNHLSSSPLPPSVTKQIQYLASLVYRTDRTIKLFWARVDIELAKLKGTEVTPEYAEHISKESSRFPISTEPLLPGEYSKAEIEQIAKALSKGESTVLDALGMTIEQLTAARIARNKIFLRRKVKKPNPTLIEQRVQAMEELHAWGFKLKRSQVEVLLSLGIEVPEDYCADYLILDDEAKHDHVKQLKRESYHRNKKTVKSDIDKAIEAARKAEDKALYNS